MKTLALTSPLTHGPTVKTAQGKLSRGGWLRAGQNDGVYGPETARAAGQAHWELGFPDALAHATTYGDTLDTVITAFLKDGAHGLPADYRKRRTARMKPQAKTLGQKALDWLRPHIGDTEKPAGSNRVEWASVWYGIIGPWCAMGATRGFVEAGSKAFLRGSRYSYVPSIVHDATVGENGLARTFTPRQGDLVCFDWNGDGVFDHVELVDDPPAGVNAGAAFTTIGCNTSFDDAGDQSNGGACAHRQRTVLGGGGTVFVRAQK